MNFLQVARDLPGVAPDTVFTIGGFPIANSFLMGLFIALLLAVFGLVARRFTIEGRGRFQQSVEVIYEAMLGLVEQIMGSREKAVAIFPVIGALLVFIGISNLIGLVPGITEITWRGVSIFRTPTADFNVTVGLALGMVVLMQIASVRVFGLFGHLGKYFQFKQIVQGFHRGIGEGFTALIGFAVGLLDIVSEVAKVISLSLRLFGNMYAGIVLATILLGALAYVVPALWTGLSLLFAVVQAMVFGALVAAYYGLAVAEE